MGKGSLTQAQREAVEQIAQEKILEILTQRIFPGLPAALSPTDHANLSNLGWASAAHQGFGGSGFRAIAGFKQDGTPEVIFFYGDKDGSDNLLQVVERHHADSIDPTVNDDGDSGYTLFALWVNTSSGDVFVLVDSTPTAAVWLKISQNGASGSFTTVDLKTVTVVNGLITSIV